MPLPYNKKLTPRAIELRKDATPQENKLWYRFLNRYPVRFRRQKPIYNFIADFYCDSAKLIIELDGSQHFAEDSLQYDEARSSNTGGRFFCVNTTGHARTVPLCSFDGLKLIDFAPIPHNRKSGY
jgi:very-short-patch-repair endonuclease